MDEPARLALASEFPHADARLSQVVHLGDVVNEYARSIVGRGNR